MPRNLTTSPEFSRSRLVMIYHVCGRSPRPHALASLHTHTLYDTLQASRSRVIVLEDEMTIDELAEKMRISPSEFVRLSIQP